MEVYIRLIGNSFGKVNSCDPVKVVKNTLDFKTFEDLI